MYNDVVPPSCALMTGDGPMYNGHMESVLPFYRHPTPIDSQFRMDFYDEIALFVIYFLLI